ncbi:TrmB family transcriptional regulator [Maledivibacter halophilus]|uniref:Sugar-specific transcriptional regulator TrmB n=1 Tax=Maledivibacter halophilus TaxID=36842 RepID=A0A1T5KQA7_9FIRM|nr:helix-turn-helix domain-containing protein [Maledivibacter halophilus]SKC65944.1 Sugar-specific transcriptional regulator TrmB [Maledivibacter halophilus]
MSSNLLIIEDMKKLGLNEYEVKAYLKLLEEYPVNGYVLSKNSGIPRSRIYEVLDNLKKKQIVFEQIEDNTTIYYPLDPELLISKIKNNFDNILSHVEEYTKKVYSKQEKENDLIVIKGRNNIIDFINTLISEAKKRIAVSIWEEEINDISKGLNEAINRGIMLRGIYFGKNNPFKEIITHRRIERYLSEKSERYMLIIIDGIHVVSGVISRGEESQVTWTKDKGFVEISEDYIAHDLMVNLYSEKLKEDERKEFESYLDNIRKEYFGFSEEEFHKFK